jgi:acetylornithine deacetylase/succinyl-diaminopimelate desuccinylase-like protein
MPTTTEYLEQHRDQHLQELLEFLRIPSISSLQEHRGNVEQAAQWVAGRMAQAGIEHVRIMPTAGHPIVYGDWLHAPGAPTALVYGHFDTQPVDPLHLWTTPPFEPDVRGGRIYARGSSDDKGNMFIPILGAEALLKTEGRLPINVRFFFEGQEEIGSPQLPDFIAEHREMLACDVVLSADSGQFSEDRPALLVGFRGLCAVQIDVTGAASDLHSGIYGGAVPNPIHALAQILASLRDGEGRITVPGFYEDVSPLSDAMRKQIASVPFDEAAYCRQVGVSGLTGEAGYSPLERVWVRPTLEVNGIWGGFQGEGTKTVLPNEAHAKITCRLVPNQEPDVIAARIAEYVLRVAPPGVQVRCEQMRGSARPYRIPEDHPANTAAADVLQRIYGHAPYLVHVGGSVPVCELFQSLLGAYTVGFGFAMDDEGFHAPNEFFRLASFQRGPDAYCHLFQRLARP